MRLSDTFDSFNRCAMISKRLAEFMEVKYIPGLPERFVRVLRGRQPGDIVVSHTSRRIFTQFYLSMK